MRTGAVMALCLLTAVIAGGVMLSWATDTAGARCIASANEIGALVRMGDWMRAADVHREYAAQWKASRAPFELLIPQQTLDGITAAYEELGTEIEFRNAESCVEKCLALASAAENMRAAERVSLSNVL